MLPCSCCTPPLTSPSQPEVMLFVLVDEAAAPHPHATAAQDGTPAHANRQHHCCLTPAVTLPGPQHATRGPTTATWLPAALTSSSSSSSSSSVSDQSGLSCSSSGSRTMLGLLVSWPSSLMLFTWEDPSTHSEQQQHTPLVAAPGQQHTHSSTHH